MSTLAPPTLTMFAMPPGPIRRFTVQEYHQMIAAGILTEDDRVELLEGWIVPKMPHNPQHDAAVDQDREVIQNALPSGWRVRVQSAITTAMSEPEPDLAAVPGPANRYTPRHPEPHEIGLVVEVAETTLAYDRGQKARAHAQAGIVCYWIVNLVQRQVEVYTGPSGPVTQPAFAQRQDYLPGDAVPLVIAGQQVALIPVADLLP